MFAGPWPRLLLSLPLLAACAAPAPPPPSPAPPPAAADAELEGTLGAAAGGGEVDAAEPIVPAEPVVVAEAWETVRRPEEEVDSVAVWPGAGDRPWLVATAKATDRLHLYDAETGELLRDFGASGDKDGRFRRPNGIWIGHDLAFVVERDNARVQVLRLPGLSTVGYVGGGELASPLGITGAAAGGGVYDLWITDAYPAAQAAAPDLGRRVRHYRVRVGGDRFGAEHVAAFGETAGPGALYTVESIAVDSEAGRLLVADEDASRMGLRDYGAGGRFTGRVVEGFDHAPEGIALYPCADGGGYWVAADQAPRRTVFLVLDRRTLEPVGRFAGERTANTDGVWLSTVPVPGFPAGALYAAHDDMSVTAFDWRRIAEALGLRADCAAEGK